MRRDVPPVPVWYHRAVAAFLLLVLAIVAVLRTRAGWELPDDAYLFVALFPHALVFAFVSGRARAGPTVLIVLAGVCSVVGGLLWLSTLV
jgi:hypothetical protein